MSNNIGKHGNAHSRHEQKKPQSAESQGAATKDNVIAPATNVPAAMASTGAQTLQQQRAKYALEQVKAALTAGVVRKEFKSYASSFPAMIQMNGLGQAAAFYFSQRDPYPQLYALLSGWLTKSGQPYAGCSDLLDGITKRDMQHYFVAQAEALLLLDWVKKFVKAYVRED